MECPIGGEVDAWDGVGEKQGMSSWKVNWWM